MYDRRPSYVGATIHLLSKGLDSGDMLFHCLPKDILDNPFLFTMRSVDVAHAALEERIRTGEIHQIDPVKQDRSREIRYSRNSEFDDGKASEFLNRIANWKTKVPDYPDLLNPWFG